jgi:hypothetical protein
MERAPYPQAMRAVLPLSVVAVGGYALLVRGALTLDLGIGRRVRPLGPIVRTTAGRAIRVRNGVTVSSKLLRGIHLALKGAERLVAFASRLNVLDALHHE